MNKQEFTRLLKDYNELGSDCIAMLKDIVKEYPYFSSANVLLAKAMSNDKHYEYEKQLKATALITGDRSVLYKIIHNIPLQSVEELHVIADISTAMRVEKISKPDFLGLEEDYPAIEEPKIESNSLQVEEQSIIQVFSEDFQFIENDVEENVPILDGIKDKLDAPIVESLSEASESGVETETNHLTKWNSFEHPAELEGQEDLNEFELALDEELRDEARLIIEESKQHDLVMDEVEDVVLTPEDSLAEATGNMLRFENIRDDNSLINLDDDDMLMDFDFGSLPGESENLSFSQSNIAPAWVELEKIETTELEINKLIEHKEELVVLEEKVVEVAQNSFGSLNEELKEISFDSKIELMTHEDTLAHAEELAEIDTLPDPFANPEEEQVESAKQVNYPPSLENLLDFEEEVEIKVEFVDEPLGNWTEENMANFQQVFDEPEVPEIHDEITLASEEVEQIEEGKIENYTEPENDIDENEVIVEEPIDAISSKREENLEEHGFMDWLVAKKDSDISSGSHIDSFEKINDFAKEEDDEFTLTIRQLINERVEKSSNVKNELTQIKEVEPEKIVSTESIVETSIDLNPGISGNEHQEGSTFEEDISEEVHPFNGYKVESVLPDFEQMVIHDANDEETNANASELVIKPSCEEKLISDEVKLVFHPIHGLVPAGFDDNITQISNNNKHPRSSVEPIIEPWTEFNESLILPTEETEITSTPFIQEDESHISIGEIQIVSSADFSDEVEEIFVLPVFDEVYFSDTDFDKEFFTQFVPLAKPEETPEIIDSEPELSELKKGKTLEKINIEPKVLAKDEKVESIIDKFIRENPNISRPKAEFYNPSNMAKWSAEEDDDLVSETLANVYLSQGLLKKAISTYEKLGLIYPHKMSYFAALINQLKTTHKIE